MIVVHTINALEISQHKRDIMMSHEVTQVSQTVMDKKVFIIISEGI